MSGLGANRAFPAFDSGQWLLVCAAGLLAVAGVAHTAATGLVDSEIAVGFGALIAAGELARLTMPGNREVAPIGSAAALGYTLLLDMGGVPARHSALQVFAVLSVGMIAGALPHLAVGRPPRLDAMARRLFTGALLALAYRPLAAPLFEMAGEGGSGWWPALGAMAVLIVVMVLLDVLLAAALRAAQVRAAFGVAVHDELRMAAPLGAAVAASGILLALASHSMGMAALLVFAAPLLVTQVAFRKYAGIRATYLQTVRALSRVTEVGGYVEPGHSRRVSRLAVAVGRELGTAEPELLELEYAALMHDIGQLSLRDPIPGGATVLTDPEQARRIAELGAEVIRQTGVLDRVAEIVRRQCDTCAETPPLASRIIKVTNAYDDLVGGSTDRDRAGAALERLRLGVGGEYDPAVVEALSRVIDRLAPLHRL
ncbi:acid phosphatase family membrane protein YuiD [Streptosporangium becharense]|uniref:Acid phosphatase family membrane protein YuiD n=1 Tax=Streptosporangium becharense TaxID=1816182 RepID=A0A7W9IIE3_9ACTN|nr:HD domain-containing phosphohydrolase [Streptosporangium becharense]MBB2915537.1 acid phosphatase family membrane protein YuiD [Streptosporangium becharense]MBB5821287.1 acid phosphatase family membrane protein YuiD [Streptosporangium becharense]